MIHGLGGGSRSSWSLGMVFLGGAMPNNSSQEDVQLAENWESWLTANPRGI